MRQYLRSYVVPTPFPGMAPVVPTVIQSRLCCPKHAAEYAARGERDGFGPSWVREAKPEELETEKPLLTTLCRRRPFRCSTKVEE